MRIVLAIIALGLAASLPAVNAEPTSNEPRALLLQTVERVFRGRDLTAIDQLYHPQYRNHAPERRARAQELGISDREMTKRFFASYFEAFPDFTITVDHVYTDGDVVVAFVTWRGTHSAPFFGVPPSGREVTIRTADLFRVEDGKFVEHWDIVDASDLFGAH